MKIKAYALLSLAVFLFACSEESQDPNTTPNDSGSSDLRTPDLGSDEGASRTSDYTYHSDIKPLIDGRCVTCHRDGGIGPFNLDTYDKVVAFKNVIAASTHSRVMPPFLASPGCREYTYDPTLTDDQIAMIADWADGGTPEGEPDDTIEPLFPSLPEQPTLDTEIAMPESYTPRLNPDDYRCFVVDWPHETTKYITGFSVRPGEETIVHHVIAYYASPEEVAEARALDDAEEGPGYTCFGGPLLGGASGQTPWLGSWAPGGTASKYPEGTGLRVEPGSAVVIQVHYNTLGRDTTADQSAVLFETADSVEKEAFFHLWANPAWLTGNSMSIPAGDPAARHEFLFDPTLTTGGRPLTLHNASIHMHLLGKSADTYVLRSDGSQDCLMDINRYDFSWQSGVAFSEPVTIQPGDRLGISCQWDNSAGNQPMINGERLTPADRRWGEGSTDEMCLGIYYATVE